DYCCLLYYSGAGLF
nr:immunoglobulin light chain junction region [Macaca mulatta]